MIVYRHHSSLNPPDLDTWEPRGDVALIRRGCDPWQYCGIGDPVYWSIPGSAAKWCPLEDGWEATRVAKTPVIPSNDLARLDRFSAALPVTDAAGTSYLAPVILTQEGSRAFAVAYAGDDYLPFPTESQARAESIAQEARTALVNDIETGCGVATAPACRWAAFLLSLTIHVSPKTISALGLLDDTLIRRLLLVAAGMDRRLDGVAA